MSLQLISYTGDTESARLAWAQHTNTSRVPLQKGLGELGCLMGHLLAVRQAYVNGDREALIMEDDMAPDLMPYWTFGIGDLLDTLQRHDPDWDCVQLQYLMTSDKREVYERWMFEVKESELLEGRLWRKEFQWATGAYLVSRKGMEKVLQRHFTDLSAKSKVNLLHEPGPWGDLAVDMSPYYPTLFKRNYITVPAMFMPYADVRSVKEEGGDKGMPERKYLHWRESQWTWGLLRLRMSDE